VKITDELYLRRLPDGRPAEIFAPLRTATLRDTVDDQVRLQEDLEDRYPGSRARAMLNRPPDLS
jgi:hypothetical protein